MASFCYMYVNNLGDELYIMGGYHFCVYIIIIVPCKCDIKYHQFIYYVS
jgi:hypothetical protein